MSGALEGLMVVELSHESCAWAGKLLAELGADTIVVEPPGGSPQRTYGPWLDDEPGPERSLYWWNYNSSKKSVVLDLEDEAGRTTFTQLIADADILIDGESPGRLAALGLEPGKTNPRLIHASITPYGQTTPSRDLPATDLTVQAGGGPVWSCGYDDHTLPPIRGAGNQAFHQASHWAVQAILVALFHREATGEGQFIDVSMNAAANVTTEMATYGWLADGKEAQRQTGRHALWVHSMPTQVRCADGRYINSGVLPRTPKQFAAMVAWLDELGWKGEFPTAFLLEMGAEREVLDLSQLDSDPMLAEILGAARDVVAFLCERLPAYDIYVGWQRQGMSAGIVYSPDEAMADPHVVAREFPVTVEHPEVGRSVTYPGAPYRFSATPWELRGRAPLLGEHQSLIR